VAKSAIKAFVSVNLGSEPAAYLSQILKCLAHFGSPRALGQREIAGRIDTALVGITRHARYQRLLSSHATPWKQLRSSLVCALVRCFDLVNNAVTSSLVGCLDFAFFCGGQFLSARSICSLCSVMSSCVRSIVFNTDSAKLRSAPRWPSVLSARSCR